MAEKGFVSAVIVAAGSSRRMGGINKLLLKINGQEVLCRSVEAFDNNADIDEIIVAAREEDIEDYTNLLAGFEKVKCVVPGGETRQKSVAAAVAKCSEKSTLLAIHDGARPLVTQDIISRTVAAAFEYGGAACGVKVKDTIKVTDEILSSQIHRTELICGRCIHRSASIKSFMNPALSRLAKKPKI